MMKVMKKYFWGFALAVVATLPASADYRQIMDLSGEWGFDTVASVNPAERVVLPGTMDTNGKGRVNTDFTETTQLSRKVVYAGPAWYTRRVDIPRSWRGKEIRLMLERTRPSTVWVDGRRVGSCHYLSAHHRYDLTDYIKPGRSHVLTVMVDNGDSIPAAIKVSSHSCTESTQTNWNGIIGRMELEARDVLHIADVRMIPDADSRSIDITARLSKPVRYGRVVARSGGNEIELAKVDDSTYRAVLALGDTARLWSEWEPALHAVTVEIPGHDAVTSSVGLRSFKAEGRRFTVNGHPTFLRGRHDACVFPLTAHVPMDFDSWRQYFRTIRTYGLNHVRFHSWCPPEACFAAADVEGVYLQPELPIWGGFDEKEQTLMSFLLADGEAIHREYSHHPSWVLFSLGNELWGDIEVMRSFIEHFRSMESRHLFTFASNPFLGWQGDIPGEDFLVTCRVGGGDGYSTHVRASFSFADADEGGYLNNTRPNTLMNFEQAVNLSSTPVIGHETGQYQIYPDYGEMTKYTGVLEPRNFAVFRQRLADAGMSHLAQKFHRASGLWATELYRADMEMNLRTPSMAGFQLLDLQDYPGQGTALVGILDAFMDSKGLISPENWRRSCDEVVLLAGMPSFTHNVGDSLRIDFGIANYSGRSLDADSLRWCIDFAGRVVCGGSVPVVEGEGYLNLGSEVAVLPKAGRATLTLAVDTLVNSYPLWVYDDVEPDYSGIIVTRELTDDVVSRLRGGAKVLLAPRAADVERATVGPLFQTDYWNYRMFKTICDNAGKPVSPGTLGILTDPSHPVFSEFPTDAHTSWQWYDIVKSSRPLILDSLPEDYNPIVRVIDNVERNHRLGLMMEFEVEGGKLLLLMAEPDRRLCRSIADYMRSPEFAPSMSITAERLSHLLTDAPDASAVKSLHNISYDD